MKFAIFIALVAFVFIGASEGAQRYPGKPVPYQKEASDEMNERENRPQKYGIRPQEKERYPPNRKYGAKPLYKEKSDEVEEYPKYGIRPVYNRPEAGMDMRKGSMGQETVRQAAIEQAEMGGRPGMGNKQIYGKPNYPRPEPYAKPQYPRPEPYAKPHYPRPEPYGKPVYKPKVPGYAAKEVIKVPANQMGEAYGAEHGVPVNYKVAEYDYEPEPVGKVVILPELYEKVAPKRDFEKDIKINPVPLYPILREYEVYGQEPARYGMKL